MLDKTVVKVTQEDGHNVISYEYRTNQITLFKLDRGSTMCKDNTFQTRFKDCGVYFYINTHPKPWTDEDTGTLMTPRYVVYIGESEKNLTRLKTHKRDRWQDWDTLVFVHHKELNVGLRKPLEHEFIKTASLHDDVYLINENKGTKYQVSEQLDDFWRIFTEVIPWLMYIAGFDFLMEPRRPLAVEQKPVNPKFAEDGTPVFHFYTKDDPDIARGYPTRDGFVVMAGSKAKPAQHYLSGRDRGERDRLVQDGTLVKDDSGCDMFAKDWTTDSHRRASRIITGTTGGGQDDRWKTKDGLSIQTYLASRDEEDDS